MIDKVKQIGKIKQLDKVKDAGRNYDPLKLQNPETGFQSFRDEIIFSQNVETLKLVLGFQ